MLVGLRLQHETLPLGIVKDGVRTVDVDVKVLLDARLKSRRDVVASHERPAHFVNSDTHVLDRFGQARVKLGLSVVFRVVSRELAQRLLANQTIGCRVGFTKLLALGIFGLGVFDFVQFFDLSIGVWVLGCA